MHKAYAYHQPGPLAIKDMATLRQKFSDLHSFIEQIAGGTTREKALAFTALQEAAMWANKVAVLADPDSVQEGTISG